MAAAAGSGRVSNDVLAERIDGLSRQVAELTAKIDDLNYVSPETMALQIRLDEALRHEHEKRIATLESANEERRREAASNRRLVITSFVAPILVGIVVAVIVAAVVGAG